MSPSDPVNYKAGLLIETMSLCGLLQYNNIYNMNNRLLDLILSNSNNIQISETEPVIGADVHHPPISVTLSCDQAYKVIKRNRQTRLNFHKANYDLIKSDLLSVDWKDTLLNKDIDTAIDLFYSKLNSIISKHTPTIKYKSPDYPFWFTPGLIRCLKEKNKYHRRYKMFNNPRDYDTYTLLRARAKKLLDSCYKSFISSTESALQDDIKVFWKFAESKKGSKSIPQTMKLGNEVSSDGREICELFSKYFGSVFENAPATPLDQLSVGEKSSSCLSDIVIVVDEVSRKINLLDTNKGPGPDGIPRNLLNYVNMNLLLHCTYFLICHCRLVLSLLSGRQHMLCPSISLGISQTVKTTDQ